MRNFIKKSIIQVYKSPISMIHFERNTSLREKRPQIKAKHFTWLVTWFITVVCRVSQKTIRVVGDLLCSSGDLLNF